MNEIEITLVRDALGLKNPVFVNGIPTANRAYYVSKKPHNVWETLVDAGLAKKRTQFGDVIYHPTLECARSVLVGNEQLNERLWG